LLEYLPQITLSALLDLVVVAVFLPWVLRTKKEATAALAWCLVVLLMPLVGALLFWVFGFTHIHRPLHRVRVKRSAFRARRPPPSQEAFGKDDDDNAPTWNDLGLVAQRLYASPVSQGNAVTFYHETPQIFAALLEAIGQAQHHIHLEFYILRSDRTTDTLVAALAERARAGVEVRLLHDAMGCVRLRRHMLQPLRQAGGRVHAFLPLNPLRSRIQINLRNHRKIVVVDGGTAFTGGMNIGNEYLGKSQYYGNWRDTFLRLRGPAVGGLQHVFCADWDFATHESLEESAYFPDLLPEGNVAVQVMESGPDQEVNCIREVMFAAILGARERVWIASPYFVPDSGLLDALRLACLRNVDVRLLTLQKPDQWLPFLAAHYYWAGMLAAGMAIYQYRKGMMHAKLLLVDSRWALAGSANLDNRSLHLNFEVGCALHTPEVVAELEEQFGRDLADADRLDPYLFARRPFLARLGANASRLLSPLL
jgi:cardiolipin synthase